MYEIFNSRVCISYVLFFCLFSETMISLLFGSFLVSAVAAKKTIFEAKELSEKSDISVSIHSFVPVSTVIFYSNRIPLLMSHEHEPTCPRTFASLTI